MTAKHYLEIKSPDECPHRTLMGPMYGGVRVCKLKQWTCLRDDKFPKWCPLKKVEE